MNLFKEDKFYMEQTTKRPGKNRYNGGPYSFDHAYSLRQ